ncbi:MAG: dual specificity protein phosphatase family protein [Deltaproteobacteria bacterium]|nr:dual specificity protein phosphatase family protein [Deltaproteobacteria bacterium]
MAGYYPGDKNEAKAQKKLKGLLDHGIRHVVNLMEPDELDHSGTPFEPYEPLMAEIAYDEGMDVTFSRMPVRDLSIPTKDEMVQILDLIDQKINANIPVYVHCWGGKGRTGTVVGCYLARHGHVSGKKVLWMIQKLRKNVSDFHLSSPETLPQMDMVILWCEGE